MKTSLLAALLLPLAALAQPAPLLDITDPEGDDAGDGSLVYPRDSAYAPGDLDLRSLRVHATGSDLRFEASFRNPIRAPASARGSGLGSEDLSLFARHGFYGFNLDIYLDTDRMPGSGSTVALPGRQASFDPAQAWDKAIVLTPRPELMRRLLVEALAKASPAAPTDIETTIERSVFFATDVRVRGRTVAFTVPQRFLDAPALTGASMTAMVTLAKLNVESGLSLNLLGKSPQSPLERETLGAAAPEAGRPLLAMGYSADRPPATAIVDLLSPDPQQQAIQLAAAGKLTGLNRENRFGVAAPVPAAATAVTPVTAPAAAASGSWFSRALESVVGLFGGGAAAPAAAPAAATNPPSLQSLMAPQAAAPAATTAPATVAPAAPPAAVAPAAPAAAVVVAPVPPTAAKPAARAAVAAPAAPAASRPAAGPAGQRARDAAFFEEQELRLRALERLRKSGLISETEYQHKRKEVLDSL